MILEIVLNFDRGIVNTIVKVERNEIALTDKTVETVKTFLTVEIALPVIETAVVMFESVIVIVKMAVTVEMVRQL